MKPVNLFVSYLVGSDSSHVRSVFFAGYEVKVGQVDDAMSGRSCWATLGLQVFSVYAMRRVNCPDCGVKTEHLEWSIGKERMTTAYKWFLSTWARRLSWSEVAVIFGTSWNRVYRSVRHAVLWGVAHREEPEFTAIAT